MKSIRRDGKRKQWGILWVSKNKIDGITEHLMWDYGVTPLLFKTRREAREYRDEKWGYIRTAKDLHVEPHGWKVPRVVRIEVSWKIIGK